MFQKKSLSFTILKLAVLPVLLLGIVSTIFLGYFTYHIMENDTQRNLANMTYAIRMQLNSINYEEYTLEGNILKKGEKVFLGDLSKMDELKEKSGADITIFYGNERILTTIVDEQGERVIHTSAPEEVQERVLERGEEFFTSNIKIQGIPYFGYYIPLKNSDGRVLGMVFAGEPRKVVYSVMVKYIINNALVIIFFAALMMLAAFISSQKIITSLKDVKKFLGKVAQGELEVAPSENLSNRTDEIGELGNYIVMVRDSLRDMIERDPLTLLYNRRYCNRRLKRMAELAADRQGEYYTVVIADIDFFKQINDKYGHNCGDYVLKELSMEFEDLIRGNGFVTRWGGEEFLLVFEQMEKQQVYAELTRFLKKIREKTFCYEDKKFFITLTFGVHQPTENENPEQTIQRADMKLYEGKQKGRNVIVV